MHDGMNDSLSMRGSIGGMLWRRIRCIRLCRWMEVNWSILPIMFVLLRVLLLLLLLNRGYSTFEYSEHVHVLMAVLLR